MIYLFYFMRSYLVIICWMGFTHWEIKSLKYFMFFSSCRSFLLHNCDLATNSFTIDYTLVYMKHRYTV